MNKIIIKIAKNDKEFVGLKIERNVITVTFPIGYRIEEKIVETPMNDNNTILDIKILMKCLDLTNMDHFEEGVEKFSFSSAFYIIDYYLKYGLYKNRSKQSKLNKNGTINWKKTFNNTEPIYLRGNIIYKDIYTRTPIKEENILTAIQKYCLAISTKIIGWIYGMDPIKTEKINLSTNEMLYHLNKELYSTNEDNKKKFIKEMIHLISGTNTIGILENNEVAIGRYYFDKVWEKLLKKELYLTFKEYNCLPNTYYVDSKNNIIMNKNLYPDMIIKEKDTIIIIDAKYYQLNSLPPSSDICKQLFYSQFIRHRNRKNKIINLFLLPKDLKQEYEYYGYAASEQTKKDERIMTYYIDTKSVLKDNQAIKDLINELL